MKGVYYYNLVQLSSTTIHSSLKACVKKVDTQLNCNVGTKIRPVYDYFIPLYTAWNLSSYIKLTLSV